MLRDLLNKTYKSDKVTSNFPSAQTASAGYTLSQDNISPLDTEASHYLTSNTSSISHSTLYIENEGMSIGNDDILLAHCIGHGFLLPSHNKCLLVLKHILHTPHVTYNSLFMHKLCADNKMYVDFYADLLFIKDISLKTFP